MSKICEEGRKRCQGCFARTRNLKRLNRFIVFSLVKTSFSKPRTAPTTIPGSSASCLFLTLLLKRLPPSHPAENPKVVSVCPSCR